MLDLNVGSNASDCRGVSRRDFLRVGGLSALGLTLANYFQLQAKANPVANASGSATRRNVNCILMDAGRLSHIDVRSKPDASAEFAANDHPTRIRVPIVEHFPLLSQQFDKLSLIAATIRRTVAMASPITS